MGSSADVKFTRWGVQDMGFSEMGSSRDRELRRWGVHEMGSSADWKFPRYGV